MPYGHDENQQVVLAATDKGPFWLQPDPVAAFISAVQKYLGAEVTGAWNPETHGLWAAWLYNAPDVLTDEVGLVKSLPAWAVDPEATARAFVKSCSILEEIDTFKGYLGLLYSGRTLVYEEWDTLRTDFMVSLKNHVVAQESTELPSRTEIVPVDPADAASQVTTKRDWVPILVVIGAGVGIAGLLWWASRGKGE